MSWSIKSIGDRESVRATVVKDNTIPEPIKNLIVLFIDAGKDNPTAKTDSTYMDGIRLETYGHYGSDATWSGIQKLELEPIRLAKL